TPRRYAPMGGSLAPVRVAGFTWNGWQPSAVYAVRRYFENIYSTGRDCAIALSDFLRAFNYPKDHPTLTHFVHSFEGGWLYQVDDLRKISDDAKKAKGQIEWCPWAVDQMIELFNEQIKLVEAARDTIEKLKRTRLYRVENGLAPVEASDEHPDNRPWWRSFDKRIAVLSVIVAVLALAIASGFLRT
ncbi:MAG: hypothetical protein AWU57_2472, partial [Marinobacter sp. T13-3]